MSRLLLTGVGLVAAAGALTAPAVAAGLPSGVKLEQQMIAASSAAHSLHGEGSVAGPGATLQISGDCTGAVKNIAKNVVDVVGVRARSWTRGTLMNLAVSGRAARSQPVDQHVIVIRGTNTPGTSWIRAPSTNNRWQRETGTSIGDQYVTELCYPLYSRVLLGSLHSGWRTVGRASVGGVRVWRVEATAGSSPVYSVIDLYVGQTSYRLLRLQDAEHALAKKGSYVEHIDFVFSRYDAPLTIAPPKIGSTKP